MISSLCESRTQVTYGPLEVVLNKRSQRAVLIGDALIVEVLVCWKRYYSLGIT